MVAVLAATALSSCGGSGDSGGPKGAKSWDAYNAEYVREQGALDLPAGYRWRAKGTQPPTIDGSPQTFQDGVGRGEADGFWYCAWQQQWLADNGARRTVAAARDLATMRRLTATQKFRVNTSPGDRHIYTDEWSRAALGDPATIQEDVDANCGGVTKAR